jgi:hypothetical protein
VKPTQKQTQAVALVADGLHPRDAMLSAGYSDETASHWKENLLQRTGAQNIAEALQVKLHEKGVTIDHVSEKIHELMNATKPFSSHTEADRDVPDNAIRIKATELAMRAYSVFETPSVNNTQINFNALKEQFNKE